MAQKTFLNVVGLTDICAALSVDEDVYKAGHLYPKEVNLAPLVRSVYYIEKVRSYAYALKPLVARVTTYR